MMKPNIIFILIFLACLCSCVPKDTFSIKDSTTARERAANLSPAKLGHQVLSDSIDVIGILNQQYTWEDMDKLYRAHTINSTRELKNMTVFLMIQRLKLEEAPFEVKEFYLDEINKIDFNIDLDQIVRL